MKRKAALIILALFIILTACSCRRAENSAPEDVSSLTGLSSSPTLEPSELSPAPEVSPEPELSERQKKLKGDITYFKNHLVKTHPEPFYYLSEEEFDFKAEQLIERADRLSDSDMVYELAALLASLGDSHTLAYPPEELFNEVFPVGFFGLGDRVYLNGYLGDYGQFEPYLLREIVAVNGVSMEYILHKLASVTDPAHAGGIAETFANGYLCPAFFDWAGCGYKEGYTFQILDEEGRVQSVEAPTISLEEFNRLRDTVQLPDRWEDMDYLKGGNWTEYYEREGQGCVYISFAEMPTKDMYTDETSYKELFGSAQKLLDEHPGSKLVIDLRLMPGGVTTAYPYVEDGAKLLKGCGYSEAYVLTGRITASAAIFCLSVFKEELGATAVGEPTRQSVKFFCPLGMNTDIVLPNSQITVQVSGTWHEIEGLMEPVYDDEGKLYEWETTVLPDVFVEQDIEDLRLGKDSAMEWVWKQ